MIKKTPRRYNLYFPRKFITIFTGKIKKVMILQLSAIVLITNCNMIFEDYVEYHPGSTLTNIIMTAPHDGHIKPASISHRQKGCYNSSDDTCDWNHDCSHESFF